MNKLVATGAASLILSSVALAQSTTRLPDYAKTLDEIMAKPATGGAGGSGNAKVEVVTIMGDASKPGAYAQLLKVGANARIPAHHHGGDRIGTVLKGTWHYGFGSSFSDAKLKTLPVGSVYTEPSDEPHYAMTGSEPVVVLITGTGPTNTVYEKPEDDPTRRH